MDFILPKVPEIPILKRKVEEYLGKEESQRQRTDTVRGCFT